jgi:chromosome segregation ATPase
MANPSSSDDFNNSTELPQDSTSTFRADVPLKRPLLERLRGCISVKRLFRLRKGARMNPIQLASDVVALSAQAGTTGRTTSMELSLRALSTQASTSHPQALNPTDLCEGITHQTHELATLVAALEKAMDQLQVLKKAQEKSAHDEVLRVMCELVGEKQARQLAAAEAENYRRRMKKAETEMGRLRARREEAEEALEGLRARHEELEKTHATTLQAHAAQCNVTVGLLTEVQARRVEAMEQKAVGRQLEKARRGLKAKDVHLKTLKQERDATLTQVEVSEAKHSEKTQRLSKALQHGQERVRELQAKEQRQAGRLETLQGSLVSAQGLVAQYQQRLQAAQALAREEAQRADEAEALVEEERRRAEEAKAEAQEERRRAEEAAAQVVTETRRANVAEAQNMAKSQELQEADAYAAQLQASLNEAQGRQGEAAQIEALQAQIAQLTMQLQQAQALVGQRDAQLAQAQGEVDRGEGRLMDTALAARRCQAAEVLVNAAEYAGLFDQLVRGILCF